MKARVKQWERKHLGCYGRAIIANTILLSAVTYVTQTVVVEASLKKAIQDIIRYYVWDGKTGVAWRYLLLPVEMGGLALKDPDLVFQSQLIRLLQINEHKDLPMGKWFDRREAHWVVEFGLQGRLLDKTLSREQLGMLYHSNELFGRIAYIWLNMGGTTWLKSEKNQQAELEDRNATELGLQTEEGWLPLAKLTTKIVYRLLEEGKEKHWRAQNYASFQTRSNLAMTKKVRNCLTPQERDYWWRLAHNRIVVKKAQSRWHRAAAAAQGAAEQMSDQCPVCRVKTESREHYDFECEAVKEFMKRIEVVYNNNKLEEEEDWNELTYDDWILKADKNIGAFKAVVIAKARWIYHKERCIMDHNRRRKLDYDVLLNRLGIRIRNARHLL
jgi:hypothetical protein